LEHKTLNDILRKEINITGSWSSTIYPKNEWNISMSGLIDFESNISGLLSHKYKFSDCENVFKDMYNKKFKFSKVVLYPD
jgi:threonine dehydrogenase-like Zn-dependent dehydrogenase